MLPVFCCQCFLSDVYNSEWRREKMTTIIGISGSLRKGSYNTGLLRAAVEAAPENCTVDVASIRGIPLYDGDMEETEGVPEVVAEIKDRIEKADALLLVTPEYNNSVPGVLKNAIDWLSRPPQDRARVFGGKPVGLMGASHGSFGTVSAQTAWLPIFRVLNMRVWFGKQLYVGGAMNLFDESGNLVDENTKKRVASYMSGFTEHVAAQKRNW
jgi:chromate reductase